MAGIPPLTHDRALTLTACMNTTGYHSE